MLTLIQFLAEFLERCFAFLYSFVEAFHSGRRLLGAEKSGAAVDGCVVTADIVENPHSSVTAYKQVLPACVELHVFYQTWKMQYNDNGKS